MKKFINITLLILLALAVFWPSTAYAKEPLKGLFDDKVVFGGTFTLESGQTLDGNLVVFGGAVTTETDSVVNGDIVLLGGVAEVGGTVNGNFVGIGGAVQLTSNAVVNGDLVTIGATLSRDENARVNGQIVNGVGIPFSFDVPSDSDIPNIPDLPDIPDVPRVPNLPQTPRISFSTNPLVEMLWFFFRTFMWALLAVLVVIFFDTPAERVSKAAVTQPLITGGAGLITAILTPFALIAMTLTIILIPVTLIAALVLLVAWLFGWVALGLEVGRRIANLFNVEWAPAISAGIGTFILFLVLGGFSQLVACVGWIPQVLIGIWALGAVVMTRFGTQAYPVNESGGQPPVVVEAELPEVVASDVEVSRVEETTESTDEAEDAASDTAQSDK